MSLLRTASLSSLFALSFVFLGCASKNDTSQRENLSADESALVDDSDEASDVDESAEVGIEESLSGAEPSDPGTPSDPSEAEPVPSKVRTNPGLFFKPAGCIVTTITGNTATSVFTNCTGPYGMRTFNGTVVSTWTREPGSFTVKHQATDFQINGATLTHTVTISYTKSGTVWTKKRVGASTGKTASGKEITHSANYTMTYDASTKCVTRDGNSSSTIGARGLERSIVGYKRCGIGAGGCPESGKITLTRKLSGLSLSVEFPGGAKMIITRPNGTKVTIPLVCNPAAS